MGCNQIMKNSFLKIIFALIFFLLPFWSFVVFAGTEHNMSGWAWSSTIGWISFNCTNDSSCATSNYGVHKNADGALTGHAWSSNIGWIQFGGLSGFPTGGSAQQNAQVAGSNLTGWVRACAGAATGDCSTMTSRADGWDGWISLSGVGYGVTQSGNNFTGFAWGSNVVGWVDWNGVIVGTPTVVPVVTISANPTSGIVNVVNPDLTWSATNSPTSCTASGDWSGLKPTSGTNVSQGVLTQVRTYTYTLTCTNSNGISAPASIPASATVRVDPAEVQPDLTAGPVTPITATINVAQIFNSTISNIGTGAASGTITHLFQYDDDADHTAGVTTSTATSTSTISANTGTVVVTNLHNFTTSGTKYIRVCADNNASFVGTVPESDENNNCNASWTSVAVEVGRTDGQCSNPPIHYTCLEPLGDTGTNRLSNISTWTWTCPGTGPGSTTASCSQSKQPPIIIEN